MYRGGPAEKYKSECLQPSVKNGQGCKRRALNVLQKSWRTIPEGCLEKLQES